MTTNAGGSASTGWTVRSAIRNWSAGAWNMWVNGTSAINTTDANTGNTSNADRRVCVRLILS